MTRHTNQGFWVPSSSTVRLSQWNHPAPREQERLWKGLERFVNCEDSENDYRALRRSFPGFWPVEIKYQCSPGRGYTDILDWHPVSHKLFLFYRDGLRNLWVNEQRHPFRVASPEFLLGLSDSNQKAIERASKHRDENRLPEQGTSDFGDLVRAWWEILSYSPTGSILLPNQISLGMIWHMGDFHLSPANDFQRAFYQLFRKGWRARVCRRCKAYFVARKPKQGFCGTACSAGSRLALNRKWWNRVGAKRRAAQANTRPKKDRKRRRGR